LQKKAKKAVLEESDDDSEESDDDDSEGIATRLYHSVANTAAAAKDTIAETITDWTTPEKKSSKGRQNAKKSSSVKRMQNPVRLIAKISHTSYLYSAARARLTYVLHFHYILQSIFLFFRS
jgi:hypothetical protein